MPQVLGCALGFPGVRVRPQCEGPPPLPQCAPGEGDLAGLAAGHHQPSLRGGCRKSGLPSEPRCCASFPVWSFRTRSGAPRRSPLVLAVPPSSVALPPFALHIGLSRTNAAPSPQWKRASEGTTVGLGRYRAVPTPQWKRASEGTTGGLGRSNAVPNPTWKQASEGTTSRLRSSGPVRRCLESLWTRASEGTAAGTSLAPSGVSYRRRRCKLSAPRTSFWSQFARFLHDSVRKAPARRGDCGRRLQPGARSGGCH